MGSVDVDTVDEVRIDKWLWAARVFKTRGMALEACRAGHVKVGGHAIKPARPVHLGEVYEVLTATGLRRVLKVAGIGDRRVGPKLVGTLVEDLTPPEELDRARLSVAQQVLSRPKGSGRPTKRDRRRMDELLP